MSKEQIIHKALESLKLNANIKGKWQSFAENKKKDGKLFLEVVNTKLEYLTTIKKEVRLQLIPQLIDGNKKENSKLMLVAPRLFPKVKETLRHNNIAYLEANGNIFLKNEDTLIWIDANKPLEQDTKTTTRAFTKTGLRVVYQFLIDEQWINKPYRQIAEQTGTGIGNVTNIIKGLLQEGFLLPIAKKEYKVSNKEKLLDKWAIAYGEKLKESLKIGTFRFLKEVDFINWKKLQLTNNKTWWGGEPAGDLLTNFLKPAELTLYTTETRNEIIKNYKLIPDEKGNVKIYQKFWNEVENKKENCVDPLLIYVDLMNENDRRCTETAKKIYDEYL